MAYNTEYKDIMMEVVDFAADMAPSNMDSIFGDGLNYSDGLYFQSPEGNFYGNMRVAREYYLKIVWDGERYQKVDPKIHAPSVAELPSEGKYHFQQVAISREEITDYDLNKGYVNDVFYWDTMEQEWRKIEWLFNIDKAQNVPYPGLGIGKAHIFVKYNQLVMWDGHKWKPFPVHSNVVDDEPEKHMPEGFITNYESYQTNTNGAIQLLNTGLVDARLDAISPEELGLFNNMTGTEGALWVSGELLKADETDTVTIEDDVLIYISGEVIRQDIQPETEYYVYCGNSAFIYSPSKLFLSLTHPSSMLLGWELPGRNARLVGKVETDSEGRFIREVNMSFLSSTSDFSKTYWEYSDFKLQYVSEEQINFTKIDGASGLCFVSGQLLNLGLGRELYQESYRVSWDDGAVSVDTDDISPNTRYYIYIANDSYVFNFNALGTDGFPLDEGDVGYIWQLDFRRRLFLSTKNHDNRLLDEQYPGFYARHLGSVLTDGNGYFVYSPGISEIRSLQLDPTDFVGLSEIAIHTVDVSHFKVLKKVGTSGVIYVGGQQVQTYTLSTSPEGHSIRTTSPVYVYNEASPSSPLTASGNVVSNYPLTNLYVYMANSASNWGALANCLFACTTAPSSGDVLETDGYLSENFPGNNARWIGTIKPSVSGTFAGSYIVSSATGAAVGIDDVNVSVNTSFSSTKVVERTPVGMVIDFAGPTPPAGWLVCNGQALSAASYPDLFAVIGYTYGGSGGTFNVPNLNDRATMGHSGSYTFGSVTGSATTTLDASNLPSHGHSHNHTLTHSHTTSSVSDCIRNTEGAGTDYVDLPFYTQSIYWRVPGATVELISEDPATYRHTYNSKTLSHNHTVASQTDTTSTSAVATGSGSAFSNMQPTMALWKIIKY